MEPIDNESRITRRESLRRAAGSFLILPAGLARGYAANDKVNVGVIGLAGMGGVDAATLNKLGETISFPYYDGEAHQAAHFLTLQQLPHLPFIDLTTNPVGEKS